MTPLLPPAACGTPLTSAGAAQEPFSCNQCVAPCLPVQPPRSWLLVQDISLPHNPCPQKVLLTHAARFPHPDSLLTSLQHP